MSCRSVRCAIRSKADQVDATHLSDDVGSRVAVQRHDERPQARALKAPELEMPVDERARDIDAIGRVDVDRKPTRLRSRDERHGVRQRTSPARRAPCQGQEVARSLEAVSPVNAMIAHAGGPRRGWARVQSDIDVGTVRGVALSAEPELEPQVLSWASERAESVDAGARSGIDRVEQSTSIQSNQRYQRLALRAVSRCARICRHVGVDGQKPGVRRAESSRRRALRSRPRQARVALSFDSASVSFRPHCRVCCVCSCPDPSVAWRCLLICSMLRLWLLWLAPRPSPMPRDRRSTLAAGSTSATA